MTRSGPDHSEIILVTSNALRSALIRRHRTRASADLSRAYHLVPPRDLAQVEPDYVFFELLGRCGHLLEAQPYSQWVKPLSDDPELTHSPLMPLVPMLAEPVYRRLTRWEVYERMPVYDTSNTAHALSARGRRRLSAVRSGAFASLPGPLDKHRLSRSRVVRDRPRRAAGSTWSRRRPTRLKCRVRGRTHRVPWKRRIRAAL